MNMLKKEKGFSPFLLLDDVFEKLDEERISNLLANVCGDEDTQIFITDTNCQRLEDGLHKIGHEAQIIRL
jgi:DNA replication and repair protein RecF